MSLNDVWQNGATDSRCCEKGKKKIKKSNSKYTYLYARKRGITKAVGGACIEAKMRVFCHWPAGLRLCLLHLPLPLVAKEKRWYETADLFATALILESPSVEQLFSPVNKSSPPTTSNFSIACAQSAPLFLGTTLLDFQLNHANNKTGLGDFTSFSFKLRQSFHWTL